MVAERVEGMDNRKRSIIVYFDSGTSNTRIYFLDTQFNILYWKKKAFGSKDSAISGSSRVLCQQMKALYDEGLKACRFTEENVEKIYASGMVTSPYGLVEIPHCSVPVDIETFAEKLYVYREDIFFDREIILVPGMKTEGFDFSFVNNMRGEEIQVIGAMEEIGAFSGGSAVILPGSHTHVAYVKQDRINGILSNFSGELFHALKEETILSPVLTAEEKLDGKMVKKGYRCLEDFGFNRSIYIVHAMRIFNQGTPEERFSFAEGVINGGMRQSIEYYCTNVWPDCRNVILIGSKFMYQLYKSLFEGSNIVPRVHWICDREENPFSVKGLVKLIQAGRVL